MRAARAGPNLKESDLTFPFFARGLLMEWTGADGKLVSVCTGTGKQKTLHAYLGRPAITGRDDRGGAMGLLFASELLASK